VDLFERSLLTQQDNGLFQVNFFWENIELFQMFELKISIVISGSDDCTVRLWEVMTGRCMRVWSLPGAVYGLEWNPSTNLFCFAVATYGKPHSFVM
jgi:WD40 repeat protein